MNKYKINVRKFAVFIITLVICLLVIFGFLITWYFSNLMDIMNEQTNLELRIINTKIDNLIEQQNKLNLKVQQLEEYNKREKIIEQKYIDFISNWNKTSAKYLLVCMRKAYEEFNLEDYGMRFSTFVAQACVESKFNPNALGSNRDIGLYQILPSTARSINDRHFHIKNFTPQMLYNPELNARFAAEYLQYIFKKGYNVGDTLESYNKWIYRGVVSRGYRDRVFNTEKLISRDIE